MRFIIVLQITNTCTTKENGCIFPNFYVIEKIFLYETQSNYLKAYYITAEQNKGFLFFHCNPTTLNQKDNYAVKRIN